VGINGFDERVVVFIKEIIESFCCALARDALVGHRARFVCHGIAVDNGLHIRSDQANEHSPGDCVHAPGNAAPYRQRRVIHGGPFSASTTRHACQGAGLEPVYAIRLQVINDFLIETN
jgi:hypothetical protein